MLVGRYRGEHGAAKQLQTDGNMPALLAQPTSRFGRGSMSVNSLPEAARSRAAMAAIRYNGKQGETDSVQIELPAPLKAPGPGRQNHTAGQV